MSIKKRDTLGYSTMFMLEHAATDTKIARWEACFGSLFASNLRNNLNGKKREALPYGRMSRDAYLLAHPEEYQFDKLTVPIRYGAACSRHEAEWFWNNWVMQNIPSRLMNTFTVKNLDIYDMGDFYSTLCPATMTTTALQDTWESGVEGTYFKKVVVNLHKIGPSDLYGVLALIRYVQEATTLVHLMYTLVHENKKSIDTAWIEAHCELLSSLNYGHLLFDFSVVSMLNQGYRFTGPQAYSIKARWPDVWRGETSVGSGNRRKHDMIMATGIRAHELLKKAA